MSKYLKSSIICHKLPESSSVAHVDILSYIHRSGCKHSQNRSMMGENHYNIPEGDDWEALVVALWVIRMRLNCMIGNRFVDITKDL